MLLTWSLVGFWLRVACRLFVWDHVFHLIHDFLILLHQLVDKLLLKLGLFRQWIDLTFQNEHCFIQILNCPFHITHAVVMIQFLCIDHSLANSACQLHLGALLIEMFFPLVLLETSSAIQWTIDLNIFAFFSYVVAELFIIHFNFIFFAAILRTPWKNCLIQEFS